VRVLVLGVAGMLGHKVAQVFSERHDVWGTVREAAVPCRLPEPIRCDRVLGGVDAAVFDSVVAACAAVRPDVVVNCIGIVKQVAEAKDPILSIKVNALFPHRLAALCRSGGARLLHVSTDCVFAGDRGAYTEASPADAGDLYGRTKLLGEVGAPHVTMRTSIIGRELTTSQGLVEWFLGQGGRTVRGYTKAVFSGLTTRALAEVMRAVVEDHPDVAGLYHVAAAPISKYDLLQRLRAAFGARVEIEPNEEVRIDRSLDAARFWLQTGIAVPSWDDMLRGLASDTTPYGRLRGNDSAS
jgi:dTDP-4-dehydrorhamnose reductase